MRLHFCRLDLPDTLPGQVGSWETALPCLGALLYTRPDNESYLVAGAGSTSAVVAGVGLELNGPPPSPLIEPSPGQVSAVLVHALSLWSDALGAANETAKFIRTMTLLEYLANPDQYSRWQDAKGNIACHCVGSTSDYHQLMLRLKELASHKIDGIEQGIRTLVVHHGRLLHQIIPNAMARRALFRELQGYVGSVLDDMISNTDMSLDDYQQRRRDLKKRLNVA